MSAYRSVSRTSLKPGAYMQRERPDHTLQPTALVNEADLRLIKAPQVAWDDRAHFFGIAARGMRQILVDHARKRRAHKRGWARAGGSVGRNTRRPGRRLGDRCARAHEALDELAVLDPRQAKIVELRYFDGLTEHEVAALARHHPPGDRGGSVLARAPPEGPRHEQNSRNSLTRNRQGRPGAIDSLSASGHVSGPASRKPRRPSRQNARSGAT